MIAYTCLQVIKMKWEITFKLCNQTKTTMYVCMQYSLWLSWSWLRHPAHWPQLSPGSGNCTCWSPGAFSASLWNTNHVVVYIFVWSRLAKHKFNFIIKMKSKFIHVNSQNRRCLLNTILQWWKMQPSISYISTLHDIKSKRICPAYKLLPLQAQIYTAHTHTVIAVNIIQADQMAVLKDPN